MNSDRQAASHPPRLRLEALSTRQVSAASLEMASGECVALSAPSGAGKTRLLRAIADLDPHDGRVYVDGRECSQWEAPAWRRSVALVTADSQWWRDTVGEHFSRAESERLRALGFEPGVMDRPVSHLSSGERQRLALLRVLANGPRVLLLDEPTASLDEENVSRVESLVAAYRRETGAAVIWVSHDTAQGRRVARRRLAIAAGMLQEAAQ